MTSTQFQNYVDGMYVFKAEHIDAVAVFLAKIFIKSNKIWHTLQGQSQKVVEFFKTQLLEHLQIEKETQNYMPNGVHVNLIYVLKGKLVGAALHYQVQAYRQKLEHETNPSSIELFKNLEKYGKELLKDIDLTKFEKGKDLYGTFGGIDDEFLPPKTAIFLLLTFYRYLTSKGIQGMFSRGSNPKMCALFKKVGGEIIKTIKFQQGELDEPLFFYYTKFDNELFKKMLVDAAPMLIPQVDPRE